MLQGEHKTVGSNQGESSNEWKTMKKNTQMDGVANAEGAESGTSDTAGRSTTATQSGVPFKPATYINIDASTENRAAQWKYPRVSDDPGEFGDKQYE